MQPRNIFVTETKKQSDEKNFRIVTKNQRLDSLGLKVKTREN